MDVDSIVSLSVLLIAAFCGGALNSIAGGGSFLTLPALIFTGVPSVAANATGTMALLPGYLAGAWAYRHDIRPLDNLSLRALLLTSLIGGASGASLLLFTSDDTFRALIPWLLVFATTTFVFGPRWLRRRNRSGVPGTIPCIAGVVLVALYGGYFNGGLGIMLLALFGLLGQTNINSMNGLKNLVSAVLTTIAVVFYALGGAIVWFEAIVMMAAATTGGYVGARWARRLAGKQVRYIVILTGITMSIVFFFG